MNERGLTNPAYNMPFNATPSEVALAVVEATASFAPRLGALSLGPIFFRELEEIDLAFKFHEMMKLQSGLSPERVRELRREALRRHTEQTLRLPNSFSSVIEDNGTYVLQADDGADPRKELSVRMESESGQEFLKRDSSEIENLKIKS